jgi:hypothetical protein
MRLDAFLLLPDWSIPILHVPITLINVAVTSQSVARKRARGTQPVSPTQPRLYQPTPFILLMLLHRK